MNLDATSASPAGATGGGTFLTPAASYGFNATPSSVSGPPPPTHKSLARYIADLQRSLKDALGPARAEPTTAGTAQDKQYQLATQYYHDPALLHPLAVSTGSHPTAPGISTLQLPWELLTSALSSFEYQILNAGLNTNVNDPTRLISPASSVSDKDRIRLLALMRETGALTLADLATEEGTQRTKRLLDRRKDYKLGFPGNFIGKKNVKEMLESIAKDAGWETFQGADEAGADGMDGSGMQTDDTPGASSASQTITMAGKGVVLDVDFVIPKKSDTTVKFLEESDESSFGTVTAVRFSYGAEGSTDPGVDKLLSRQAKAADWPAMRESLLTLARLDDVISLQESMSRDENAEGEGNAAESASGSDLDPFSAMKMLTMQVEGIFKSEL